MRNNNWIIENLLQKFNKEKFLVKTNEYNFSHITKKIKIYHLYHEYSLMNIEKYSHLKNIKILIDKNYYWVDTIKITINNEIKILSMEKYIDDNFLLMGFFTTDLKDLTKYYLGYFYIDNQEAIGSPLLEDQKNLVINLLREKNMTTQLIYYKMLIEDGIISYYSYQQNFLIIHQKDY